MVEGRSTGAVFHRRVWNTEKLGSLFLFAREVADGESVSAHLSQVMMAQAFQDITGQVIRKVIALVQGLERDLSALVDGPLDGAEDDPARGAHDAEGDRAGHGPAALEREKAERVSGQGDVDDLLAELGV